MDFFVVVAVVRGLNPTRFPVLIKRTNKLLMLLYGSVGASAVRLLLSCGVSLAATPGRYHNCHHPHRNHSEILFNKSPGNDPEKQIIVTATCES